MGKIDVHCHAITPSYRQYLIDHGHEKPDGMPAVPPWNVEAHLELQQQCGISKSILSISSPGVRLVYGRDDLAQEIAYSTNEDLAQVCAEYPSNFGFFASLPLPNVADSLAEIEHAYKLGAAGFVFMSNYHSVYPGDRSLDEVFAELNRRNAVVFIHPTSCNVIPPDDPTKLYTANPLPGVPRPGLEFMFDESRAVVNLLMSGTVERYPNITYIASHCGTALPPLLRRVEYIAENFSESKPGADGWKPLIQDRFYFDMAGFPFPDQIHGMMKLTAHHRLLYGSDFPFTPGPSVVALKDEMDGADGLEMLAESLNLDPEAVKASVYYEAAAKILPA